MSKPRICIIMFGGSFDRVRVRLRKRLKLFSEVCENVTLIIDEMPSIAQNNANVMIVDLDTKRIMRSNNHQFLNNILLFVNNTFILMRIMCELIKISNKIDVVLIPTGIPIILPLIIEARLLAKRVILMAGGSAFLSFTANNPNRKRYGNIIKILEIMCYSLTNMIAAENLTAVKFIGLEKYIDKIAFLGTLVYVDENLLSRGKDVKDRENLVGFIGNINRLKGIENFVQALPILFKNRSDIRIIIGGDGPLLRDIERYILNENIQDRIKIMNWIPYETLSSVLNELKLLVVPSFTEGLPSIILEAMASGTPVLATSVGGIPEIIIDGETGFIMPNNTPDCIAANIIRAIESSKLNFIADNARKIIENEFTYSAQIEKWKALLVSEKD